MYIRQHTPRHFLFSCMITVESGATGGGGGNGTSDKAIDFGCTALLELCMKSPL